MDIWIDILTQVGGTLDSCILHIPCGNGASTSTWYKWLENKKNKKLKNIKNINIYNIYKYINI